MFAKKKSFIIDLKVTFPSRRKKKRGLAARTRGERVLYAPAAGEKGEGGGGERLSTNTSKGGRPSLILILYRKKRRSSEGKRGSCWRGCCPSPRGVRTVLPCGGEEKDGYMSLCEG